MVKRVVMFIDSSNFYFHSKKFLEVKKLKYNWESLIEDLYNLCVHDLEDECELSKVFYYCSIPDPRINHKAYSKQKKFLNTISNIPNVVVKGSYLMTDQIKNISTEKGVDTQLSVDMTMMAVQNQYDIAILLSADGDFCYAAQIIKNLGKYLITCNPPGATCKALYQICDKAVRTKKCLLKNSIIEDGDMHEI